MKSFFSKKMIFLTFVVVAISASAQTLTDYAVRAEPTFLLLCLLGLGVLALGRLRHV
jgi:hypothetical protein